MKAITPSAILRARAWDALKATWPAALAGSALINLADYVLNQVFGGIPVVGRFLSVLVTALLMIPMQGLISGVLGYLRGRPLTFDCIQSMFPHWRKIFLLVLWLTLCLFGWMMIGAIPMVVGSMIADMESLAAIGALLMLAGIVLMLVLMIRATLDYSMSQCILIDSPNEGARNALRKSREMIRGCRWHYVKVCLPVYTIIGIAILVIVALTMSLPEWLSLLIASAVSTFTNLPLYYYAPVMYEELRRNGQ